MRAAGFALGSLAVTAMLAAGCASMSIGTYVSRDTDWSRYRTYAWAPADALPAGDARLEHNGIFVDYFQGAVERGLHGHNLLLVSASDHPDLLIHFHGSVRRVLDVADVNRPHDAGVSEPASVVDYDEATLTLDMVDARTTRLLWRGWAVDSMNGLLGSRDRMKRTINEAVSRMLTDVGAP
jgi:hypothetical protein